MGARLRRTRARGGPVTESLGGPGIVLALVLIETAVGGLTVLWLTPSWGRVRDGFFKLTGSVIVVAAGLARLAGGSPLLNSPGATGAARAAVGLMTAFAIVTVLWQVLLWLRLRSVSHVVGLAAVPVGIGALGALAAVPSVRAAVPIAALQLVAGSVFMGAVTDGLLLGHWHLVDRTAARAPLARMNLFFLVGCGLVAAVAIAAGTGGGEARSDLSPLLGVGVLTVSIAVGLAALCALIGAFIRALIKESSMQSATGLFYLGVIMAFAAEFAAKVRFF